MDFKRLRILRELADRPLVGVRASRSIVALSRPEAAARTTIRQTLGFLQEEVAVIARASTR